MIKLETLEDLLQLDEGEIEKQDTEKLKVLLGVLRYSMRVVERKINEREPLSM